MTDETIELRTWRLYGWIKGRYRPVLIRAKSKVEAKHIYAELRPTIVPLLISEMDPLVELRTTEEGLHSFLTMIGEMFEGKHTLNLPAEVWAMDAADIWWHR